MSSYFSNTEYHLESRRETVTGLYNNIKQGNRSALASSVGFNLYNNEGFSQELNYSGSDWDMALGMNNNISNGIYNSDPTTNRRNAFDNKLVLGLSQAVTARTFTEFDSNLANSLKDSRNSLKFLTGEAYRIDPSETKAYASQTVFENIFGSILKQKGMYIGSNDPNKPQNYYVDQSYEYASAFITPIPTNVNSLESRGQETLDRLVYSDLFGGGLVPTVDLGDSQDSVEAFYDNRFNNKRKGAGSTISDLDFVRLKSMTNELTKGGVTRTKRITMALDVSINDSYKQKAASVLDDVKYQTRPGILPFVAMFESANNFITIDSFQYQNRAVSDVVVSKIYREVLNKENYNFKVKMIVGSPIPGEDGTGTAIFGPNILEVAKMEKLKEVIITELINSKGKRREEAESIANSIFNIELAGPAHHRKVYITDQVAALGSINLTSPVGDSIFKAGSNFEMMVMFKRDDNAIEKRKEYLKYVKTGEFNYPYIGSYGSFKRKMIAYSNFLNDFDLSEESTNTNRYKKALSALMYKQVEEAQKDQLRTRSSQANIKYATDIMYTLKATLDYLHNESGRDGKDLYNVAGNYTSDLSMNMVLDQAYFLHVNHLDDNRGYRSKDNTLNKNNFERGEMGSFDEATYNSSAFKTKQDIKYDMYRAMQRKNFALIAMGINKVVVDSKNFRSQVIEPTWDFISSSLDTKFGVGTFSDKYGGSIGGFVSSITQEKDSLATKVKKINATLGINNADNLTAYQVLAIASGNISGANVPRQHSKSFSAIGRGGIQIAGYTGSANLSMSNLGVGVNSRYLDVNSNDPFVSDEMGVVFINRSLLETSAKNSSDIDFKNNIAALNYVNTEYALQYQEEMYEAKELNRAVVMSYNQLNYGNRLDNDILNSIEGLPYWAKQSNTKDLLKLESTLKEMSKGLGDAMSITRKYDRFGTPLMLEVSINVGSLVGMNTSTSRLSYTLGMLQGTANQPGPVFFQKEGKLIYNSNFTNDTGNVMSWMYGDKPGFLSNGQSAEMSSIDNTTSIFATMIAEMSYRQTISNPANKLIGVDGENKRSLMLDFTTSILGLNRGILNANKEGLYTDGLSYSNYLFESNLQGKLAAELEGRFTTKGISYLDNTRDFAGIDVFNRSNLRDHIDSIRNATSGEQIFTSIASISSLIGEAGYEDLALDVLRVNSGYNAERDLNAQMRSLSSSMLDPYLQMHQANSYGAGVANSKYINYGMNAGNAQAINMLNLGETTNNPLLSTLKYARTFARDVTVYSGFGNDYEGNERFYIGGVAEGVSTQTKSGYQLQAFGVRNKFPTDRNSIDILEGVGIGTIVNKQRLSNKFSDKEADLIMARLGIKPNENGILFNLDANKPAQINQRIKNALGSRLLYEVNEEAASIIRSGGILNGFRRDKQNQVKGMVDSLVSLLGDNDQAKKFIKNYLSAEEVNLGSMYDTDVRNVLNESAYNFVLEQRKELFDQFKDVGELDEQSKMALNYMFRLKMVNYSSSANSIGSVVGGRRDKPQFMILQLNGGYSDHFYLNPAFRTQYYAAASTTTTTGIKASMLDARTYVGEIKLSGKQLSSDGLVIKDGDMFMYDSDLNKVVQMTDDGNGNRVIGRTYVGGTGSSDYLMGQIENFSFGGKPVASIKQRSTSNRPGEDSVQLILRAKTREGGSSLTNEIIFEVSTLNLIRAGSGRRQEGTAASLLFKGVGAFINEGQFSKLYNSFKESLGYEGKNSSAGVSSFKSMNVALSDVYGLINPNNLKSGFFLGHAAALLTTDVDVDGKGTKQKMAKVLVNQDRKTLAAALVSQFGLGLTTDFNDNINSKAINAFKKSALKGEYGTYIRMLEMQKIITGGKDRGTPDSIFGSIPQFIMADGELTKAINDALIDGSGNLDVLLDKYVSKVMGETDGYLINSSDMYTRGVSALLTAIDMFGQLKNQKGDISVVTDWMLKSNIRNAEGAITGTATNDPLVEIAAILGGSSNALTMSQKDKDELAERMGIYLQQNYAVALALNVLPSASKDPLGKNLRAKTELQHLLAPLEAQKKQFTRTGGKNNLAYVLGTVFAAQDIGMISLGMSDNKEYLDSIEAVNALDPTTLSGFFAKKFIGVYYNASSDSKALMDEYKRIYKPSIRQGFEISKANQYFEDGSLTIAEATYADRENKKKSIVSNYAKRLINAGEAIVNELKKEAYAYNLEQSKGMGTDITQPKLEMLMADNNQTTYNVLMPEVVGNPIVNEMTGDYNIVFSNTQNKYMFMPGAELLNQVGSSFGDFVSEIVGKSIGMYSYFTPGTLENDLLVKIAKAKQTQKKYGSSQFNINLSREEAVMLNNFYNLGDELLQSIIEASSDTLVQKAVAGHGMEFDGYVSTPIPNLALNFNMNVMPQFANEKYGALEGISKLRQDLFDVTAAAHLNFISSGEALTGKIAKYDKNRQVKGFVKTLGTVLDYQKQMLVRGMSNIASLQLQHGVDTISAAHSMVNKAQKGQKIDINDLNFAIKNAEKASFNITRDLDRTGAYDKAYVASYVLANLQFAKIKIQSKKDGSLLGNLNAWMKEEGYQDAIYLGSNHEIRDFIHNSTEKNRYSMGLDLVNHYSKQLEGAMRGKHTVYKQTSDSITELLNNTSSFDEAVGITTEYIDRRIKNLEGFIDNFAPTSTKNAKTRQEDYLVNVNRKSVSHMINDMINIRDQVVQYKNNGNTSTKFLHYALQELGYIHNNMSELDNMQNQSWRSAPFGSTESHLGTLMAVRGISQFNDMMSNLAVDENIVRFDADRSKSLSMFSGLSFLTSNLGDFDGDNYITLMHKISEKIESIDNRQFVITLNKNKLNNRLYSISSNEEFEKIERTIAREEQKLQEDGLALKGLQVDVNSNSNQSKMAKDVAAYMGIDSRFFRGESEGGFRSQGTIAISSMSAMLEQGRGLYGGLQGVSSEINTRVDALLNANLGGINASGLTFDSNTLAVMTNRIQDNNEADKIFKALGMTNLLDSYSLETQQDLKQSLDEAMRLSWEQINSKSDRLHNYMGEATTDEFFATLVSKLHSTTKASDALGKVMGAGLGIGMNESTYDVLTKTLGKAGSDVLGKTYNTLLGTFVADSPIVSLHHILEGHSDQIAQQMNNVTGDDSGTKFMANLQAGYDKAQELQGWNKAIQQMLRDSIKLKGDSKSVMEELRTLSEEYVNADEGKRMKLIDTMASKIGPGAGMKGLMDLNRMITTASTNGGNYGKAEDYNLFGDDERSERGIAETLTGYSSTNDEGGLIKYKVSNSLRSISTMFNFEKNYGAIEYKDGRISIEDKLTSNRALEATLVQSLHGFLGKDSDTRGVTLLLAEHAMGSREEAKRVTDGLYNAVDGINSLGFNFKGENRELYNGYRDKLITEQMNKFSAEIIKHNPNGVIGTMLNDHMGIDMSEENMAELNKVRSSGLSTASLLLISHHSSINQTKTFMGDYGEGLDRFVHINRAAQTMQRNISKGFYETGTNILGSDLFNAAYRLMAQGKLGSEGGNVMTRLYKAVNDPNLTNADAMGQMLSNFSGDEESAKNMAEMYKHLKHVEIQHEVGIDGLEGKKETVSDLINRQSKKTSQGFKLQAISEIAKAMNNTGDMSDITYNKIASKIGSNNFSDDEAKSITNELLGDQGLLLGGLSQEGKDYFKPQKVYRGSDGTSTEQLKVKAANGAFNLVGPALLSMIGGAVYGTSKDGAGMDPAGVIGGTLSLMGFNMPHGKGMPVMAGALFRSKAYNNPDEDWTTNLAKATSTEMSLSLVGTYVTPKLTDVINRNVVAPIFRNNVPIAESGISAIIGSFVGAIAMNMLDSTIQQGAGLLKNSFNAGDNSLNSRIAQLQDNLSEAVASRGEAEIDPMSNDRYVDVTDKLDIPPLVIGVWATDSQIEGLSSDSSNETYLTGGETGYV